MPFDKACKDRYLKTSLLGLHTNKATMKPAKPQRPAGVYKVFTKLCEGKKSSLGQKLCTSYLNTYHYTTGSRRTRGSRVEKKRGKTQSILMIKNGSSVSSNLGTQNNTQINSRGGRRPIFCMRSSSAPLCFSVLTLLIWKQSLFGSPRQQSWEGRKEGRLVVLTWYEQPQ